MNYSPILAPVVALIIWKQVSWLTAVPRLSRAINERPRVAREERPIQIGKSKWSANVEPLDLYLVCMVLALMNAGRGFDCWVAWACATCWVMQGLTDSPGKGILMRALAGLCAYVLVFHAGIQITRDLLAAYG